MVMWWREEWSAVTIPNEHLQKRKSKQHCYVYRGTLHKICHDGYENWKLNKWEREEVYVFHMWENIFYNYLYRRHNIVKLALQFVLLVKFISFWNYSTYSLLSFLDISFSLHNFTFILSPHAHLNYCSLTTYLLLFYFLFLFSSKVTNLRQFLCYKF